ncbi:hypothetical protein GCM10025865_25000 [Paraoerskovia sediminicola]|uniref:GDSL-like Lipase/Acylhydrolase family protein n=1 Tax=Paraoerskovia sediminicola TaxID=1138587 RepID=A0ABM8G545_9CELL|nr:hypothetical protein [Paraoerskovia sediminicola]BDZ43201.1 hypothetical protein GCM10025865_25000 [Paraoerskovia sediminicola]
MTLIGDSVALGSAGAISGRLDGILIDARVSRQMKDLPDLAASLKGKGQLRDYVVVALATNSTLSTGVVERAVSALGDRHVVLVNGYGDRSWIGPGNKVLAAVAKKHGNVVVADWRSVAAENRHLLGPDGIHPQLSGTDAYARVIERGLAAAAG